MARAGEGTYQRRTGPDDLTVILRRAKGHGGPRIFYDRKRDSRVYHVFSLARVIMKEGSFYRLTIGQWCICFGAK